MNTILYIYKGEVGYGLHTYSYNDNGRTTINPSNIIPTMEGYQDKKLKGESVEVCDYTDGFILENDIDKLRFNYELSLIFSNVDLIINKVKTNKRMVNREFGLQMAKHNYEMLFNKKNTVSNEAPNIKKYWKPDMETFPLFPMGKLYATKDEKIGDKYLYRTIRYESKPKKKGSKPHPNDNEQDVGSKQPLANYAVFLTTNPVKRIDEINKLLFKDNDNGITRINLKHAYKASVERDYALFGSNRYIETLEGVTLSTGDMVGDIITNPGLIKVALSKSIKLQLLLSDFVSERKVEHRDAIEITDLIWGKNGRGVTVINSNITQELAVLRVPYKLPNGKKIKIPLTIGGDTLDRNGLKRLEKLNPRMHVIVDHLDSKAINFYSVIEIENKEGEKDYGLYTSYYTSVFLTNI